MSDVRVFGANERGSTLFIPLATIAGGGRERMPIQLTPEAEALIREKVKSGLYANAEVAVETAVQLLDAYDHQVQRLRNAIAEGEEGEATPWTPALMAQLNREADGMYRRGAIPDPDNEQLLWPV